MNNKSLKLENATFNQMKGNIKIEFSKEIPNRLYKYYSVSNYAIKGLKNKTLYFSHAHLLNDVMDGNFMLWDVKKFVADLISERQGVDNENDIYEEVRNFTKPFLKNKGVLSLSNTYKNELIWVHYTNECGYCLELETDKLLESVRKNRNEKDVLFFPVSYDNLKQLDFSEYITTELIPKNEKFMSRKVDANLPILYCFAQKDKFWKYEKEWRLLINDESFKSIEFPLTIMNDDEKATENNGKSSGNVEIEKKVISKIILAPLFFNNERFNKSSINGTTTTFHFKTNENGNMIREFLQTLKSDFNDKIYQIEKFIKDKRIARDIKYKIQIARINELSVDIIKSEIE
jgi:thiol-disulfide isomerase/thioredoxin